MSRKAKTIKLTGCEIELVLHDQHPRITFSVTGEKRIMSAAQAKRLAYALFVYAGELTALRRPAQRPTKQEKP